MSRQRRCRRISGYPDCWSFSPDDADTPVNSIILTLDEYETIRLIDLEGQTQEQCAGCMGVSRTTVTTIYNSARKKLAEAIVGGKNLRISGGSVEIVGEESIHLKEKGQDTMRVAVTYENGEVFQHFGHTKQFKVYDIKDGKIMSEQVIDTNGRGHGALAGFLKQCQADALICGGIGMGAQNALTEAGITFYGGVSGNADEVVKDFAEGKLSYNPDAKCDHHEHHGEGHECGRYGCGESSCHE